VRLRIRDLCAAAAGKATLRYWPTLEALLLAAVLAAAWPVAIAFFGRQLVTTQGVSDLGMALGLGLQYAALLLWVSSFTRQVCRSQGLGESHFQWSALNMRLIRRHLSWLTWLGLPVVVLVAVAERYQDGQWLDSLGRLGFVGAMLLLAAFMHALLGSKEHLFRESMACRPDGWLSRSYLPCRLLAVCLPLALAILAAIGFHYSAQQLAFRFLSMVAMVLGLALTHALLARWFLIKRRRRALEQLRQRQTQEADAASSSLSPPLQHDRQDLSSLHEQLRYLLRYAVTVLFFVGSWMIWADVLPALKILDSRVLWWSTVEVAEMHESADGTLVRQKIEQDVPTTLRHALFAVLLLIATFIFGRHLPALLEVTLLERLPLDRGARHAISVIFRYGLALTGVAWACRTMSITWTSVQWLAAGMTVGLGFGLQEIFANFVSGLILLFERPIRVGDVITLGDVTGTVTNIRIRATTVTDWDRKELIVPNKDLVTGRLLNWTLSDTLNRITLRVGLAYDSDTTRARDCILAVAQQHPSVLAEPAPLVTFESFGESTLNFVLRCYVGSMDSRLATIHDLHTAVHHRLQEEGIEIAFPQRVVSVRSPEQLSLARPGRQAADAA
jgi:potassium efflux system protein